MSLPASATIPLSCKVCTRRSDYSDLSHLLTHIASKAHLSNYYNLKLKSGHDAEAQRTIDEYDDWYDEWGFQDMMQERMAQKEIKKESNKETNGGGGGSGASVRRGSTPGLAMASVRGTPAPASGSRRQSRLRSRTMQHVDPSLRPNTRLAQHPRSRPQSRPDTPVDTFSQDTDYSRANSAALPPVQNFSFSGSRSPIKQESISSEYSDGSYEVPQVKTRRRRRAQAHLMSGSNASINDDNAIEELVNDNTKLKGIVWPGMDLFDSATPDMKRKRNQKKHGSVLLLLQATSEETDPLEMVFRGGSLQVQRTITGNPESDDNLISGESEPEPDATEKKPARRRARAPLADKNTNNGRVLRKSERGGTRTRQSGRPIKVQQRDPEEDEDDAVTYRQEKKRRTGLSIHRDNSGPDITFGPQSSSMNVLTSAFDNPSRSNSLRRSTPVPIDFGPNSPLNVPLNVDTYTPRTHYRQQSNSWGQLNAGFRPIGFGGHNMPSISTNNFGQYNSHVATAPQHHSTLASQQHFGQSYAVSHNDNPLFQPHPSNNDLLEYSMFGFDAPDLGIPDMTFQGAGEIPNPLFLGGKSDDEETVSAANSEH
ncbi:uncharacterized protein RCC_04183 [Ramularia collo-cygni]|uniref:Uncharacterized protein n=1 Tax=Ramularia collo-cygni TaxID=112498 RepID=A0A2D3V9Y1_9PEZI|nr:uncharacterized protein RCC_04183 [Ramularia collo-cygni]CZT18339.1 uncharacterized protein RCC_04183 [Ramularia collo-cygni]